MLKLAFDEVKATQAAARLVGHAGGKMKHLALIKLLYKIDRSALKELGLSVTTDEYAALPHGPVTSKIYDLIKANSNVAAPSYWRDHLVKDGALDIVLKSDPGSSELSRAEENLIDRIFKEDGSKDRFQLRDESHENYPEWRDPNGSSRPISIEDILRAVGADEDEQNHTADAISIQKLSLCCRTNS